MTPVLRNVFLSTTALIFTANSFSAPGVATAQIEYIRTHDPNFNPAWAPPIFWLTLKGVTHAGNCSQWGNPGVLFVGETNQELALALSAQASGSQIEVNFDDSILVNGFCKIIYLSIGNPAPTI